MSQVPPPQDEFYVGYLPDIPSGVRSVVRRAVLVVLVLVIALAISLPLLQKRFDPGVHEWDEVASFAGRIELSPYPTLRVQRPGAPEGSSSEYLLVKNRKQGADVDELQGQMVDLTGSLIYRPDLTMIELAESPRPTTDQTGPEEPPVLDLGTFTLRGEIVDSKCFLGVMKPGRTKPHKSCAIRCIAGGIPPAFYVEDGQGNGRALLLVGESGQALGDEIRSFVGEPLEITGQLTRRGETVRLAANPEGYRRL